MTCLIPRSSTEWSGHHTVHALNYVGGTGCRRHNKWEMVSFVLHLVGFIALFPDSCAAEETSWYATHTRLGTSLIFPAPVFDLYLETEKSGD